MEKDELKKELNSLGDLIDHLNLTINHIQLSDSLNKSFQDVIDYYNEIYDALDNELTEFNNVSEPSWMELYLEEKYYN